MRYLDVALVEVNIDDDYLAKIKDFFLFFLLYYPELISWRVFSQGDDDCGLLHQLPLFGLGLSIRFPLGLFLLSINVRSLGSSAWLKYPFFLNLENVSVPSALFGAFAFKAVNSSLETKISSSLGA